MIKKTNDVISFFLNDLMNKGVNEQMIKKTLTTGRPSASRSRADTLASLADDKPIKRVTFELSADLHLKLKLYAAREEKSIKDILTEYIKSLS